MTRRKKKALPSPATWVKTLKAYTPGEQPTQPGFIKLNTNESAYPPAPQVLKLINQAQSQHLRLYPDPLCNPLRRQLAKKFKLSLDHIIVGNGSDEVLRLIAHCYLSPGSTALALYPTYTLYEVLVKMFGAKLHYLRYDSDSQLPPQLFKATRAKVIFLSNPNPPYGTFFPPSEIKKLCRRHPRAIIVADEAYVDFASQNCLHILPSCPNLIITRSMSKSFALAGLRLGYAFAHPELIHQLFKLKDSYNVNSLIQHAGLAALRSTAYYKKIIKQITSLRDQLTHDLRSLDIHVPSSQANFIFAQLGRQQALWIYQELKKRKILVRYFNQPLVNQGIRITIGTETEMKHFWHAFTKLWQRRRP